jgi:hypothetical protein
MGRWLCDGQVLLGQLLSLYETCVAEASADCV